MSPQDPYRQQPSSCCPAHLRADAFLLRHPQYTDIAQYPTSGEYAWTEAFVGSETKRLICRPDELEGVQRSRSKRDKDLSRCHMACRPAHIYSFRNLSTSAAHHLRNLCPSAASAGRETLYFRSQSARQGDDRRGFWGRCLHCALGNLTGCPCEGRDMDDLTAPTATLPTPDLSSPSTHPSLPSGGSQDTAAQLKAERCQQKITKGLLKAARLKGQLAATLADIERQQYMYAGIRALHPSLPPAQTAADLMVKKASRWHKDDGADGAGGDELASLSGSDTSVTKRARGSEECASSSMAKKARLG